MRKDPVFRNGEIVQVAYNGDTLFKIGDGVTPYSKLKFVDACSAFDRGFIYTNSQHPGLDVVKIEISKFTGTEMEEFEPSNGIDEYIEQFKVEVDAE